MPIGTAEPIFGMLANAPNAVRGNPPREAERHVSRLAWQVFQRPNSGTASAAYWHHVQSRSRLWCGCMSKQGATTEPVSSSKVMEPLRVFLAEDDSALRATIALLLEKDGHQVIQARDGIDLMVDLASSKVPTENTLIVTDMRMPMIGGMAILRSLCRERDCPPFILMTAFATAGVRSEALQLGAIALFDKPFDLDQLRRVVRDIAESRAAARPQACDVQPISTHGRKRSIRPTRT
jgi:two-component system, response regulator, stage 0 sporulation protein F